MGWLEYDISVSPKENMDKIFTVKGEDYEQTVLASCTKGNVYYAAVHQKTKEIDRVLAVVCLYYYSPKRKKGFNFGYKGMDETMGPCKYNYPERYLNMLTEPINEYSRQWREEVRRRIDLRKRLNKLKAGDKIQFESPVETTSGAKVGDTIIIEKRKKYFVHGFYRWPKQWIPENFTIIKD